MLNKANLKRHISNHVDFTDKDFEHILSYFYLKEISKNQFLLKPGQICKYESFVAKGLFQTTYLEENGKLHTISFPHENWWAGDFNSFKNQKPSGLGIQALEDSSLLCITFDSFYELLDTSLPFSKYIGKLSERYGLALQERIVGNLSMDTAAKYKDFIDRYPLLRERLSQRKLASYLGVSPEHLSKTIHSHLKTNSQ